MENLSLEKAKLEIRVGINTGSVVAGVVGTRKFAYDIWGDTVNVASRMESSGAVSKVNISESTYNLIKDNTAFTFEFRGEIEAKGKGKVNMYFVDKAV
jgi:class 3 adenylate cyclase